MDIRPEGISAVARRSGEWRFDGRCLSVIDTLIKALEKRGFGVVVEPWGDSCRTYVNVQGTKVKILLRELQRQVEIRRPPERRYSWQDEFRTELKYTGQLMVKISQRNRDWSDGVLSTSWCA